MENKVFVFIGSPGSGKGSISELCVNQFGWKQLSTGDILRKHIEEQTEIGKHVDFTIKSGKLVNDSIVIEMVNEWLVQQLESGRSIILDGYPRNIVQAEALDSFLKEKFQDANLHVVRFVVPDEVVVERLCNRYVCQNKECQAIYSMAPGSSHRPKKDMICDKCSSALVQRADDKKESIRERLKVYHEHEKKMLDFYGKKLKIIEIDAQNPLDVVFENFKTALNVKDQ